jgi:hypothetical protein
MSSFSDPCFKSIAKDIQKNPDDSWKAAQRFDIVFLLQRLFLTHFTEIYFDKTFGYAHIPSAISISLI